MKIECDKCGAKYSIADEKVRGKTFKIRCKKCSNVIIVRDKAGGAGASSASMSAEADTAEPGWHLAINGETVGPLTEAEVRSRFDTGEIDKETAIWQEGFDDWIALSEVSAFSDLARRPASRRGDDPFASGSDDDYAAPSGPPAYPSASRSAARSSAGLGLGGLSASTSDSRSPRVSSLTAQRNENSVLFSLDSLQALAMGGGGAGASRSAASMPAMGISSPSPRMTVNPGKPLATQAPASEGSGLIDIRSLGGMMGGGANRPATAPSLPTGPSSEEALPSFGGGGFGGLAAAPLIAQPAPTDGRRDNRSNTIMYVMVGLVIVLMGGMGSMMYFMVNREPSTTIVEKVVPGQVPSIKDAQADEEEEDKKKAADEDDDEKSDADDKAVGGRDVDDKKPSSKRPTSSSSKSSSSKSSTASSTAKKDDEDPLAGAMKNSGSSSSSSKPAAQESKPAGDDMDVDCILDPSKCGTKKKTSSGSSSSSASDPSLPEKLAPADIKAGIASVKDDAKACGSKHGAAGTKVKVRLSISGDTGRVASAAAQAPHGGTPLGNCVAAALKKAQFKKFKASSIGVVYPVSL